eukprot:TRINITY_DN730_c1_g1_i1.p1 TRINITY_DN730_c1_g1~~TRINITY_DN730_c1_g1_i1.p1  ORF type:complete len:743 (-),score=250.06 TRINITY_DN730_c1_g1_i1:22-2250(-)
MSDQQPPQQPEVASSSSSSSSTSTAPPAKEKAQKNNNNNNNNNNKPAGEKGEKSQSNKGGKKGGKSQGKAPELPPPAFFEERIKIWDEVKKEHDEKMKNLPDEPIVMTLPDGKSVHAVKLKTTPYEIAKNISRGLADACVVAKVDGQYYDMHRPLENSGSMQLFKFDSPEGKHCFWHSSSHVLGQTLEARYSAHLTIGPAIEEGFYYDIDIPQQEGQDKYTISAEDLSQIDEIANGICKQKQPFERLAVPRDTALKMFAYNKYKQEIIGKIPQTESVTLYKCGPLIDLCRGPHLPNTSLIKAFKTTKNSGAYWLGKAENPLLQRVYGIAFPEKKQLSEWEEFQAEAARRDHRVIGKDQQLFFFHPYSPGCAFFLPHGARIYNRLVNFIKAEYHNRGFTEVMSPNAFNKELWEISGHWQNYKDNMFVFDCDNTQYSLKPMNCPGHCLMFDHGHRSYRDLPLRFADFGVLHRNELAGALTGLTRVRRFQQDDAHIFCTQEQINAEVQGALGFMQHVYGIFGYSFTLELSTRPEKFLGDVAIWDKAEKTMEEALNAFGQPWTLNPGDGAFYGPKIDIHITDALKRSFQCATIQLDFQLPIRFKLAYSDADGAEKQPVIIHRAILGSVERMMAILIEHTAGKWPFWLSPRQVVVVNVSSAHAEYAKKVQERINAAGYYVDAELSDKTISNKIRQSQGAQYNYILVVGEEEMNKGTVSVRTRDNVQHGQKSVDDILAEFAELTKNFK